MKMKQLIRVCVCLCSLNVPQVFALSQNTSIMNQVSVSAICMVSAEDMQFGIYDPTSGAKVNATTTISVTCVNGAVYNIYLSAGLHSGSNVLNRNMQGASSGELLSYQLYGNASMTGPVWGDGSVGTDYQCGIGTGAQSQYTVYGMIPSGQSTVPVDNYSDVISVTVTY
jgi:spore coat protein U-like protein